MNSPTTTELDLVDRVIAREAVNKPLREASKAVSLARAVVARSIEHGYIVHEPIWDVSDEYRSLPKRLMQLAASMCTLAFPIVMLIGAFSSGLLFLAAPVLGVASLAYAQSQRRASVQFSFAATKLASAKLRLKNGNVATLLKKFAATAKVTFALAKISVIQENLAAGDVHPRRLRKLEKTGMRLIDKAARDFSWDADKRGTFREAFRKGQLPKPQEYVRMLDEQRRQLEDAFNAAMAQPDGTRSVPPTTACRKAPGSLGDDVF